MRGAKGRYSAFSAARARGNHLTLMRAMDILPMASGLVVVIVGLALTIQGGLKG